MNAFNKTNDKHFVIKIIEGALMAQGVNMIWCYIQLRFSIFLQIILDIWVENCPVWSVIIEENSDLFWISWAFAHLAQRI